MMNLLFFQNCISPHQVPYIKELCHDSRVASVHLVVPRIDYSQRADMGWNGSKLTDGTQIKLHLRPTDGDVHQLFAAGDTYAFFSGIRADADVFRWFRLSLAANVRRGIITERPNVTTLKPLLLHRLRFMLQDSRFVGSISYVFAFGDMAAAYYRSLSKQWKVVPFGYCTSVACPPMAISDKPADGRMRLLFVGTINRNKNIMAVLNALAAAAPGQVCLHVVGDGPERLKAERCAARLLPGCVAFHGSLPMAQAHGMMHGYDALVLPSKYDGWGAVVNEALQCGLYVICSDRCGARSLITDKRLGHVFHSQKELQAILSETSANMQEVRGWRDYRRQWAERISGKSMARYFIDNLCTNNNIPVPWEN